MYRFRNSKKIYRGVSAETAASELERIRKKYEQLKPEFVVNEAKNNKSPLHSAFTWDDKKAADEHRLWEARYLIKNVVIVREDGDEVPAFVNVVIQTEDDEATQYYQNTRVLTVSEYDSAKAQAKRKLGEAAHSLAVLEKIAPKRKKKAVSRAIDEVNKVSATL